MGQGFQGKKVVVYGIGKSGVAAARLLIRGGARVSAVDDRPEEELGDAPAALRSLGVTLRLGTRPQGLLNSADLMVVSPGVPLALPEIRSAAASGVKVWAEVELAWHFLRGGKVVGITGTNGKSTTTALTGELLVQGGRRVFTGGNLGRPLCDAPLEAQPFEAYCVELSSFQLEGTHAMRVNGAALLNFTPDHLDRYAGLDDYGAAKARIFRNQEEGDFAVVNVEDPGAVELSRAARVPLYGFSIDDSPTRLPLAGRATRCEGGFQLRLGSDTETYRLANPALRGDHNLQNAMAAALLARLCGVSPPQAQAGLDAFAGLAHRLESVRTLHGVEWINDSKATNVDSSLVALRALPGNIWLIAGGRGKRAPYAPLVEASRGKLKGVLTIGEDATAIGAAFGSSCTVYVSGTLERAVARAYSLARPGDIVLLSPACASYDQFHNFEERGDSFKKLARSL